MKVTLTQGRITTFDELKGGEFFVLTNADAEAEKEFVYRKLEMVVVVPDEAGERMNAVLVSSPEKPYTHGNGILRDFVATEQVKPVKVAAIVISWDMRDRNELPF